MLNHSSHPHKSSTFTGSDFRLLIAANHSQHEHKLVHLSPGYDSVEVFLLWVNLQQLSADSDTSTAADSTLSTRRSSRSAHEYAYCISCHSPASLQPNKDFNGWERSASRIRCFQVRERLSCCLPPVWVCQLHCNSFHIQLTVSFRDDTERNV